MGLNFADQKEASEVFDLIKEKSKRSKENKLTVKPVMTQQQPGSRVTFCVLWKHNFLIEVKLVMKILIPTTKHHRHRQLPKSKLFKSPSVQVSFNF